LSHSGFRFNDLRRSSENVLNFVLGAMGASGALLTIYCTVTEIAVECWIAPKVAVTVTVIVLRWLNFGDAVAASARRRAESWRPASRGSAPRVSGASCRSPSPERRPSIPAAATRRRVLLPARR